MHKIFTHMCHNAYHMHKIHHKHHHAQNHAEETVI